MNDQQRTTLVEVLTDISTIRARRGHPDHADQLRRLAADVAAGKPTVLDQVLGIGGKQ